MPDYLLGKTYRLVHKPTSQTIYVGSTCDSLSRRLANHRTTSKQKREIPIYKWVAGNGGWDDISIVLIQDEPCDNREQLLRAERAAYDEWRPSLNAKRPQRTEKERMEQNREKDRRWKAANVEKCRENYRLKYAENTEKELERTRRWRAANVEKCRENPRQWNINNRERHNELARLSYHRRKIAISATPSSPSEPKEPIVKKVIVWKTKLNPIDNLNQ